MRSDMTPRSLDELLADAEVLQHEYDDEDTAASRLRIEREVADTWWRSALLLESSAQQVKPWLPEDAPRHRTPLCTAQHEQAAQDLRKLSTLVIRDSRAAHHIALLAQSCRAEPASALIFACLLHLADREGSQFWWQFSMRRWKRYRGTVPVSDAHAAWRTPRCRALGTRSRLPGVLGEPDQPQ